MNNAFWVTSEAIYQWFSRVTKSRVKIIGKSHHEWPKTSRVKIIGKSHHEWPKKRYSWQRIYYFISYTQFYVLNTQFFLKQSAIGHIAIVVKDGLFWLGIVTSPQLICDVTPTGYTSIVTSYSSIVLIYLGHVSIGVLQPKAPCLIDIILSFSGTKPRWFNFVRSRYCYRLPQFFNSWLHIPPVVLHWMRFFTNINFRMSVKALTCSILFMDRYQPEWGRYVSHDYGLLNYGGSTSSNRHRSSV